MDDPRYYRAGAVTPLSGREHVRLAREYFYSLWNDPRARVLKSETGIRREEIESLRARLSAGGTRESGRDKVGAGRMV